MVMEKRQFGRKPQFITAAFAVAIMTFLMVPVVSAAFVSSTSNNAMFFRAGNFAASDEFTFTPDGGNATPGNPELISSGGTGSFPANTPDYDGDGNPGRFFDANEFATFSTGPANQTFTVNGNLEPEIYFFRQQPGNMTITVAVWLVDSAGTETQLTSVERVVGVQGQGGPLYVFTDPLPVNVTLQPGDRLQIRATTSRNFDVLYGSLQHPSSVTFPEPTPL